MALGITSSQINKVMTTTGKADTTVIRNIPLDKLVDNPNNEYIFGMNDIDKLAKLTKDNFKGAIVVYEDKENGTYEIASGHRRVAAQRKNGAKTIPCLVFPMPKSSIEKAEYMIDANVYRKLSPINMARSLEFLKKEYEQDNIERKRNRLPLRNVLNDICERYGISKTQLVLILKINKLVPKIQQFIENEQVAYTSVTILADESEEIQNAVATKMTAILKEKAKEDENATISAKEVKEVLASMGKSPVEGEPTKQEPSAKKTVSVSSSLAKFNKQFSRQFSKFQDAEIEESEKEKVAKEIDELQAMIDEIKQKL